MSIADVVIRPYSAADHDEWGRMRTALWPGQDDMTAWLARPDATVIVAARAGGVLCGFAEAGERAYADGCESSPVAYLEGWYVDPDTRRQGVGGRLVRAVEEWARARGLQELASDTLLDNVDSQRAHERLGFAESERHVLFRKSL
jgi:aminoglycoside 6'-N-acetyltransferase I